jgi:hypothetical protein
MCGIMQAPRDSRTALILISICTRYAIHQAEDGAGSVTCALCNLSSRSLSGFITRYMRYVFSVEGTP